MNPAATPVPGGPRPASPAAGSQDGPSTTVRIRPDIAALPAYVPGARPDAATAAQIAKLSSNELPYPPQDAVVEAITRAATGVNRYPEMTGESLTQALARRWGVEADQVVVGNGSVALIQHLLDAVCEPGDEVVIPWRSFEAYLDFVTDPRAGDALTLLAGAPNLVVSRTFSKAHALAGVRVGYAIADPEVIGAIQSLLVPFGVNSLALAAALASLADAEAVQRAVAEIVAERERIVPALRELGYDIPDTQSNFYLLRGSVYGLVDACARVGLIVRPFREGVRVSVGSREQNDLFYSVAADFARAEGIAQ